MTSTATGTAVGGFIQYCEDLYMREGMKDVCLALQDRHGLNVNILLAAVWAAGNGYAITPERRTELEAAIREIDAATVQPIRALRRRIQSDESLDASLRLELKKLLLEPEIRAEQAVEARLFETMARWEGRQRATILDNVLACADERLDLLFDYARLAGGMAP